MPTEMILKRMRIRIPRRERQTWEPQPNGSSDLRLHDIAHVAVDMGVEIRTNRLMDGTHAKRLLVRQQRLIPERGVNHNVPWCRHAKPLRGSRCGPRPILVHLHAESP